jgi:retron-type reverse transcriptase
MRRAGGLWEDVVAFRNLWAAARAAARGKRFRPDVASFRLDLEREIPRLRRELLEGTYAPGPYRTFVVHEAKPRLISAAPFRDRVVHHALTQVLEPIFERRFTGDSFACRKGFGTHRALDQAHDALRRHRYVLKCDIVKYFASIDHEILDGLLARVVKCRRTLALAAAVIAGSNPQEEVIAYFAGDDLFTPFRRRRGLPLGNQTSQFFANVYLNPLDHFIRRELRPGDYTRYVDDFLLFADDKEELHGMRARLEELLATLRLRVHPRKSRVYRASEGVTFLGWRLFPDRRRLVRGNVVGFRRRLRELQLAYAAGEADWQEVDQRVRAWIAHAEHGHTWRLREQIFARHGFVRGSAA